MIRLAAVLAVSASLLLALPAYAQQTEDKSDDDSEPIVYTNEDLPPPLPTTGSVRRPPEPAAPDPGQAPAPVAARPALPSYEGHRDRNGHGEGWWRHRAAEFDIRVYQAHVEAQKLHVDYLKNKALIDPTLPARSREATQRVRELEAERDRLPDELRDAGGFPGWLRRGGVSVPDEPLPAPAPEPSVGADGSLTWNAVPRAAFYLVEVECSDCCGPLEPCEVQTVDVSGTSAPVPFEAVGSGRWRVCALDAAGFGGEWSAWQDFATVTP